MQVSLEERKSVRVRDFCDMADVPGVLFSLNDDLLGRIKIGGNGGERWRRCVPLCKVAQHGIEGFKAS